MARYPHKAHRKLGSGGVKRSELTTYSREILEASKTPLTTKQIADLIQQKTGAEVNLQILGSILSNRIAMIQRERKKVDGGFVSFYALPQLFNVVKAKE